jgi:hypothetical protein
MINSVKSSDSFNDPRDDQRSPHKPPEDGSENAPSGARAPSGGADIRLVIEEDGASGALLYKLIDRATGEVVSAISRDELIKMGADPLYSAGKVIDTTA